MPARMPTAHLEEGVLISRYESLLRACYLQGTRLRIPTLISDAFHETRIEVGRRGLSTRITLPSVLNPDDPDPIFHNHSIVRYLEEPFLSQFFSGSISLAPAKSYATQPNSARRDNEHERPFMHSNQIVTINGISYPATDLQLKRQILGVGGLPLSYHFISFSSEESLKLARDFEADGCVIIRDYSKFFGLLEEELLRHYPEADISLRTVTYYDPSAGDPSPKTPYDILSHKPIGYYYQHEVRIIVTGSDSLNDRLNLQISPPDGLFQLRKFEWPS